MTLVERFNSLPRAVRWAAYAGAIVIGYFVVVEPALVYKQSLDTAADEAYAVLRAAKDQTHRSEGRSMDVRVGRKRYGEVLAPAGPDEAGVRARMLAFSQRITEILDRHAVTGRQETTPQSGRLSPGPLSAHYASVLRGEATLLRMVRDIEFTASPETVAAVIADLESTPEISALTRVQIRKADAGRSGAASRLVTVNISAETWIVTRRGSE